MNSVTPKAGAKLELLFNKPASGCYAFNEFLMENRHFVLLFETNWSATF
jgi:hypothetical protein